MKVANIDIQIEVQATEEDEANAEAGVIMREFNQQFPQYMELKPIVVSLLSLISPSVKFSFACYLKQQAI